MKKRSLFENLEFVNVIGVDNQIAFDNAVAEWGAVPNPQLSVLLTQLRYLFLIHQTHHWISRGSSYYGDHLLFMRLYENIDDEIDALAEKMIGLGTIDSVSLFLQIAQVNKLIQGYGSLSTVPTQDELARRSLAAEMSFLKYVARAVDQLKSVNVLTRGLDNLLAGIEDKHEEHVYLLKQRCTSEM